MIHLEKYKSPNELHRIHFILEGEIRFGPPYYKIAIDDYIIPERIFGLEWKWHSMSTFLALQEWLTIDYKKGPITALTLIDLNDKKIAKISIAEKGFIKPINFENNIIIYKKEYFQYKGKIENEYEINIKEIKNWAPYNLIDPHCT